MNIAISTRGHETIYKHFRATKPVAKLALAQTNLQLRSQSLFV